MKKTFKDYINGKEFNLYGVGEFGGFIKRHKKQRLIKDEKHGGYKLFAESKLDFNNHLPEESLNKNNFTYLSTYTAFLNINDARKESIKRLKDSIEYLKRIGQKKEIIEKEIGILNTLKTGTNKDIIFNN
jgi:DNA polymerase III alpha subunit